MSESSRSPILRFACVMMAVLVILAHPAIVGSVSAAGGGEFTSTASSYTCQETSSGYKFCIEEYSIADSSYEPGQTVSVDVTIDNRGDQIGTVEATLGVQDTSDSRTYPDVKTIEISKDEQRTLTLEYTIPDDASSGTYDVTVDLHPPGGSFLFDTTGYTKTFNVNRPPSSSVNEPTDTSPTINVGQTLTFETGADDPDGDLAGVEWYVDGSFVENHALSGGSGTDTLTRTFSSSGTYVIEADVYDEKRSYNDQAAKWTVEVQQGEPDLTVTNVEVDPSSPSASEPVEFRLSLKNQGNKPVGTIESEIRVDGELAAVPPTESLDPGESTMTAWTGNYEFTAGSHTVTGIVDPDDHISESDEGNNKESTSVDIEARYGSVSGRVIDDQGAPVSGAKVYLDATTDTRTNDNGEYEFTQVPEDEYTLEVITSAYEDSSATAQVTAGETTTQNFEIARQLPDLRVTSLKLDPSSPKSGDPIDFRVGIKNVGTVPADTIASEVRVDGSLAGVPPTTQVAPGETASVQASAGYEFSTGTHTVTAIVDPDDEISERNENNNRAQETVNIKQPNGDLTVDVRHQNGDRAEEVNALVVWQDEVGGEPYKKFENNPSVAIKQKINNLPGDHRYKVNAYINDQFAGATDWVNIKNSDKSSTIRVENPVWIKPTVYYTDGSTPLEDATVKIESHEGTQWRSSTTEEDGLTSAGKLWLFPTNKGRYDVQVYSEGSRVASKTLNSLDSNRDLRLVTSVSPPTQIDTTVVGRTVREETEQDGTITVGERTTVGVTIRNDGTKMPLRTVFQFDTDGDGRPEAVDVNDDGAADKVDYDRDGNAEPGTVRGDVDSTVVPAGETQAFGLRFAPDKAGDWRARAVMQTHPDDKWTDAGTSDWDNFSVVSRTEENSVGKIITYDTRTGDRTTESPDRVGRDSSFDDARLADGTTGVEYSPPSPNPGPEKTRITTVTDFPWSAVGHLRLGVGKFGGGVSQCSGTIIEDNHVLTAAHCVYDDNGNIRSGLLFTPAKSEFNEEFGRINITKVHTYTNYKNTASLDIAVLTLAEEVGTETGEFGLTSHDSKDSAYNSPVHVTGYPTDPPTNEDVPPQTMWNVSGDGEQGGIRNSLCADPDLCHTVDTGGLFNENTRGGMSGGPIWRHEDGRPQILSVTSKSAQFPSFTVRGTIGTRLTNQRVQDVRQMIRQGNEYDFPPSAHLKIEQDGLDVALNAAESIHEDGRIETYRWDLDDDGEFERQSDDPQIIIEFPTNDRRNVTVQVVAPNGQRAQRTEYFAFDNSASPDFQSRAIYVWGYADDLATDTAARERFLRRADEQNLNTVFLSWGALSNADPDERADLLRTLDENGIQTHAMIGAAGSNAVQTTRETIPEVLSYNAGQPNPAQFDGIHLDAEPGDASLKPFLSEYQTLLSEIDTKITGDGESVRSQELAVSSAVGWWWGKSIQAPQATDELVESSALDYVVLMAYYDEVDEVRQRTAMITDETDTPYVVAIETQEFAADGTSERVSFYEEGSDAADSTLQDIADDPPSSGHLGGAYHYYQSSVSTWDALESASLRKTTIEPGDRVTVDTDVVFDDNFPQSSHRSQVRVEFHRQGSTYTVREIKTITPPGNQLTETSVEWQAPTDAQPGEYQVTASLVDTTRENDDREAVASRSEPITLDQIKLGTLEINEGAPSISDFAVEITDINNPPAGEQLEVTTEITNTGEQTGQATVQLDTTAGEIEPTQTTVNLGGGDSTTETLPVDTTGVDPGSYTATMSVGGTASDKQFTVTDPASLIADAGDDQTVTAGETVTLDATGSSSPDMGGLGYRFKQLSQPDSLPDVSLNNPETQTPEFTAPDVDSETTLTFELTITQTDSTGTTTDTDTDQVNITITPADDPLPTTSLRFTDQTISSGSATLSVDTAQFGNQTVPGEKFVVVVHKTTESIYDDEIGPKIGESDVLSPGTQQSVEVDLSRTLGPSDDIDTVSNSQSFVAMLHRADTDDDDINHGPHITRNGDKVTSRAQVTVSPPPGNLVADAGPDQTVTAGKTVELDASGSTAPENSAVSYRFQQVSQTNDGSSSAPSVSLRDPKTQTPEFTAPSVTSDTTLTFELTVTDGTGGQDTDTVAIVVEPQDDETTQTPTPTPTPPPVPDDNETAQTTTVTVTLDSAPAGLQRFNVSVTGPSGSSITTVSAGVLSGGSFEIFSGGEGDSTVTARGVDLAERVGQSSDPVRLYEAEFEFEGTIGRSDLTVTVTDLTNNNDTAMSESLLTVTTSAAPESQTENPVIGDNQAPATDPDSDGQLEDVNGDGEATFDDTIALAFNTDDASENRDSFDFDDDGDVDFDDAISLAFQV